LKGLGQPINGPLPSLSWAAATAKDGMNSYPYSPSKANALFNAAGWKIGKDGWRIDPITHKTADLHMAYTQDPQIEAVARAVQQDLQAVHVKVTLDPPLDFNTLVKKVEGDDKNLWMWTMGWSLGVDPDPRGLWNSTDAYNFERWVDKHNDSLIAATYNAKAFNKNIRKAALVKWQVYVNQQLPLNFLYQDDSIYAFNNRLHIPAKDWAPTGPINVQDWTLSN
ncbi:MAG: hypothetical protein K6T83_22190, partial [Alicyclobacillus sp.]|nr:hypothetical protein [Alicyclobacillus sp.]